jgi:hypothetical protein
VITGGGVAGVRAKAGVVRRNWNSIILPLQKSSQGINNAIFAFQLKKSWILSHQCNIICARFALTKIV